MKTSYVIKHFLGTFVFFALIFISAGRFFYWQGLVYVGLGLIMAVLNYTVFKLDPELMAERSKAGEGSKKWDKTILGLSFLLTLAMFVTAGLDSGRFNWSPDFHIGLTIAGIFLTATGQLVFLMAQKQNKFFSSTVRIQTDRGHTVCDTGLYSFVRHPAYLGSIIQSIGFPLLFGSIWSILPIVLSVVLQIVRTSMEDRVLKTELTGYHEYSLKIKYKLIPFIW